MIANTKLIDIRSLSLDQLKEQLTQMEWLWKKSVVDFEEMSNLSITLREKLKAHYVINSVRVKQSQVSADKTIKSSFVLYDNNIIEGVLIPTPERMTACVCIFAISG